MGGKESDTTERLSLFTVSDTAYSENSLIWKEFVIVTLSKSIY